MVDNFNNTYSELINCKQRNGVNMMKETVLAATHKFNNGITVVNASPNTLRFMDSITKELVIIEPVKDLILNTSVYEVVDVNPSSSNILEQGDDSATIPKLMAYNIIGSAYGESKIRCIEEFAGDDAIIIGSLCAVQAYPGKVLGPSVLYEDRFLAPDKQRMSDTRFLTFAKFK